jgi:hypothetical protein
LLLTEYLRRESFIDYNNILNTLYNREDNNVIITTNLSSGISIVNTNPILYFKGSSTFYYKIIIRLISLDLIYRRLNYISEARVKALANK